MKFFLLFFFFFPAAVFADPSPDFHKIFTEWTEAFNHKELKKSCELFSPNVIANYRGVPEKNYGAICDGFKKVFKENKKYVYQFKLHQVYQTEELAAVRITWYLKIFENGKEISSTKDQGLDVFRKNKEGQWQIVNYLGYSEGSSAITH